MKLPRRQFLHLAAGAAALPAMSRIARAQAYPARPVRLIAPFAAGGNVDLVARIMGELLSQRLGQPFIIENRPGAGTNIGTEAVVRAPADGYTLLLASPPAAINATLYEKLNFNFIRDIAPIASVIRAPFVMEINPSAGIGTGPHLAGELFKIMASTKIVVVHYRGTGPALTDLIGGQVQLYFDAIPASIEHIKAGKLRALAVTTITRSELLPETPPLSDFLPDYDVSFWAGIGAPKNTPNAVIDRLNQAINTALADPKIKSRFADLGGTVLTGPPADFSKLIADDTEKWGKVIRAANIKAE